jgi:AraC-like DNA-binding protein
VAAVTVRAVSNAETMATRSRYASGLVSIATVICGLPRSGPNELFHVDDTFIGIPMRGVFTMHAWRAIQLLHPTLAVVLPAGAEYRMSHPTDEGDAGLVLRFAPAVLEEALRLHADRVRITRPDLAVRRWAGVLTAAIERGADRLRIDEMALALLRRVAGELAGADLRGMESRARAKIERVRILLAESPEQRWTLDAVAALVGYSPFYLAHQFRAHTGQSLHQYVTDLRVAAALTRIEAGDSTLAAVAADLGFSHHSHLTATLRKRLGMTPQMVRWSLREH